MSANIGNKTEQVNLVREASNTYNDSSLYSLFQRTGQVKMELINFQKKLENSAKEFQKLNKNNTLEHLFY